MRKALTNLRLILLVTLVLLALIAISPRPGTEGAAIRSVARESAAAAAGIPAPEPNVKPVARERIIAINGEPVVDEVGYYKLVASLYSKPPGTPVTIETNKDLYRLATQPIEEIIVLNETELVNVTTEEFDEELNETVNVTHSEVRNKTENRVIGIEDLGLTVYDAPTTNVRKGLDLSGGTRVILKPAEAVPEEDLDLIVANIKERLNVYGLSDLVVRTANDLGGEAFVIVEIAGANKEEVRELLSNQGKFEAKIGNETVFLGGDKDITYVCRTADCSGIDPTAGCGLDSANLWNCRFRYSISLSPEAAQRQAAVTRDLEVVYDTAGGYLSQPLELYLDDQFVDSLQIAADLKGKALTDIEISGSGSGTSRGEAMNNALANMRQLQTVMITGSLPVQLEIVKTDSISPTLGREFVDNAILIGLLAVIAVATVVAFRYREWRVALPMVVTMISEAVIILGVASAIGWNLDLAAIAAIIISIGTGVDDQIVIADETLRKEDERGLTWKERFARAFFIIMAAFVTTLVAMLPLLAAGAGMLRGFAITTIIGVSIGVFVTRPAYGVMMQLLVSDEE